MSRLPESDDGKGAAERTAQHRDGHCEQQHHPIDADVVDTWQLRRRDRAQQPNGRLREQHTEQAARERQHHALRQQRAGDPAAAGAECGTHGELLMAPFRAHQEQVRDVAAGDQQHDADGCQQNPENLSDVADHVGRERAHVRPQLQSRERGRQERDHARDIGVRLGERDARFHPRERLKPEADAARRVHIQGHRQHDRRARPKELERRGQHADDFNRPAVDDQLLADDVVRAPETALPVAMGQHHSPRRAGRIVFGAEGATENGLHAQQRQCRRADEQSLHPFRIAASRDRHLGRIPGADPLEYLVVLAIRQIRARAVIRAGPVRRDLLSGSPAARAREKAEASTTHRRRR